MKSRKEKKTSQNSGESGIEPATALPGHANQTGLGSINRPNKTDQIFCTTAETFLRIVIASTASEFPSRWYTFSSEVSTDR